MVSRRASAAVAALALAALTPGAASAGLWPQPAMGPSRSGDPELVLTFDDGPHPTITPQLLDMLEAHDLHAVFFWVGWRVTRAPDTAKEIIERAVAEGHVIANHTINHAQLCTVEDHVGALEIDGAKAILEGLGTHHRGSPEWMAEAFLKTTGGDPKALLPLLDSFVDTSEAELRAIAMPTLVVSGAEDHDNGSAEALADLLPDGHYVEIPGNHMSAVTKPELGGAIADFLAR